MKTKFLFCLQMIFFLIGGPLASIAFGQQLQWFSQMQITDDPSRSEFAHIVTDSQDNHHIFWIEGRDGNPLGGNYWYGDIYYSKLDKQGNVQVDQKPVMTMYSCYNQFTPAVDSNDNLHLTWTDGRLHAPSLYQYSNWEVYYKKLDNNGNTIINDLRLTEAIYYSGSTNIALDQDDNIYIVWSDLRHRHEWPGYWPTEAYYSQLDNNGNILISNKRLTYDFNNTGWPFIAVDSHGNIHLTHYKYDYITGPNNRRVFYTKLDNDGNILIPDIQIGPIQSAVPNVAVDSNDNLHVVWVGTKHGVEGDVWTTYYKKLDKYGATLVNDKKLCPGNLPSIELGPEDNVHVASIAYGNSLYYYRLDPDGEITFDNNGDPIDTGPLSYTNQSSTFIDVDSSGNVHIVWSKLINSNSEVFYLIVVFNQPPVALCKDIQVSADQNCQAFITPEDVDGGCYDPDEGDEITVSIDNEGPFSPGIHDVTLTVTDEHNESDTCQAKLTVVDTTPPLPDVPTLPTVSGECSVEITSIPTATDNCTGTVTGTTNDPLNYTEQGTYTVTWTYDDGNENTTMQTQTVIVKDITPPTIENLSASPNVLWPPNHKMAAVTLNVSASDNCDDAPHCQVIAVSSNEPVNGLGDGDTDPDWEITGDLTVNLRAERSGTGSGRIYTITVMCTDISGNNSTETVNVTVSPNK
ncbi:MAG: hypothetical protein JSV88_13885 [Candidatus Aminicenantes bacterium]|nr:MAG: hypothetical protein JSV88_13885 [Candidatus Aminicenantes bacterium]